MKRKNFYVDFPECNLCDTYPEETLIHLFFECSFSLSFWWEIGFELDIDMDINNMIQEAKSRY